MRGKARRETFWLSVRWTIRSLWLVKFVFELRVGREPRRCQEEKRHIRHWNAMSPYHPSF